MYINLLASIFNNMMIDVRSDCFISSRCNGLNFGRASESPGSDLARRTPGEIKKRGLV